MEQKERIAGLRSAIEEKRASIEHLKNGTRIRQREGTGGEWLDITEETIASLALDIEAYEDIIRQLKSGV